MRAGELLALVRLVQATGSELEDVEAKSARRGLVAAELIEMHGTRGGAYYTLATQHRAASGQQAQLEGALDDDERVVRIVARIGPAGRGAIAREFYGRSGLTRQGLNRISGLLRRLTSGGRLRPQGEGNARIYRAADDE